MSLDRIELTPALILRFLTHVDMSQRDKCWLWVGSRYTNGYGSFGVKAGGRWTPVPAHRFAWTVRNGKIPSGLHIDHLCRTPLCVRPDHLEPVTPHVNALRGSRATATHCTNGHEYTERTVKMYRGWRYCRLCQRESRRKRRQAVA